MKRIIEFPLEEGGTLLVEVMEEEEKAAGGVERVGRVDKLPEQAQQTFTQAVAKIKPVADTIITMLRQLNHSPDEVEVEFGIKLNAEAGAFIASAGAEANFKVTLNWKCQT